MSDGCSDLSTALQLAVMKQNTDTIRLLLDKNATIASQLDFLELYRSSGNTCEIFRTNTTLQAREHVIT